MGKKYLDTKEGSLEQSVLGVWQTAIDEGEARMDGRTKQYKEHRAKLESRRSKAQEKLDPVGKEDGDIDNDGDKDSTDKYLAKRRKAISKAIKKDKKEETDLEEGPFSSKSSKAGIGDVAQGVRTIGKKLSPKERDALQKKYGSKAGKKKSSKAYQGKFKEGSKEEYQKFFNAAMKKFGIDSPADLKSDEEKKKFFDYVDKNYKGEKDEEVQKLRKELFGLEEGKMSDIDQMVKDGKSAEEIAKALKMDVKSVKKVMGESYEIGTDEYRKHTENVTPGEDGEWVDAVNKKNDSMREALAKVWGVSEGKSPFEKKSLTKEVKDGKTMTGKKIASVDINPTIKEKKK